MTLRRGSGQAHRAWLALVILVLLATSRGAAAQPAGRQDAEQRHRHGLELLAAKDFAAAAIEFAAAHQLDPQPRYLFNLALAQRRSGRCREAIQNYHAFLATTPPPERAASARSGIQLCDAALAAESPRDAEPRPRPASPPLVAERAPWPRRLDIAVGSAGVVTAASAVALFVWARREARATFEESATVDDYRDHKQRAETLQPLAWIATGTTVGIVAFEVVRYLRRPTVVRPCRGAECRRITVAPVTGGGVVCLGGSF